MIFGTKNSITGQSHDMREWATPSGGGGKLKFFAHKNNYTKHLVNLIRQYITAKEHGDNLGNEMNDMFNNNEKLLRNLTPYEKEYITKYSFVDSMRLKKGIDTLYTFTKVLPIIEHYNGDLWKVGPKTPADTIVQIKKIQKTIKYLEEKNSRTTEEMDKIFRNGDY